MPLTQLSKSQWQPYFDRFSRTLAAKRVEIETAGLAPGRHVQGESIPVARISYDPTADVLVLSGDQFEHVIRHPKEVHLEHEFEWVHGIEVVDQGGERHIMVLKDPLLVPVT